ncbi:MAG: serine/threonine-protein kinase [Verrucomicrobiota bacterium]
MNNSPEPIAFVAPEPDDLAPLFPGYEIEYLIATGGMGAVYRAVQRSLDRTVALKILPMEFSQDAEFCAGFEAEAKAMARLNHPNLIGVHDFGEVNGMLYIVMEFVPGKSIYHSAHDQAIDPGEVIRLVTSICHGLAHAHQHGILHRDIKPSNILLTLQAEPKIGDFGLARTIDRKTEAGETIFGTPGYTAPEVIDDPDKVDHRADLFSIGVLLHELLTGKLPADDPRPASMIAYCDFRFDAIIQRATHPSPAARYSSATEIAGDLRKIAAVPVQRVSATGHAMAPVHAPPSHEMATQKAKKSSIVPMVVSFLTAVLLGSAAFAWFSREERTTPRLGAAPPPVESSPEPPIAEITNGEVSPQPAVAPSRDPPIALAPITPEPLPLKSEPEATPQESAAEAVTRLEYGIFIKKEPEAWVYGKDGGVAGIPENTRVADAFKVLGMPPESEFRIHVAKYGWRNWKLCEGNFATGNGDMLEAIQFRFSGGMPEGSKLYGRVYLAGSGWQKTILMGDLVVLGGTGLGTSINAIQLIYGDGESGTNPELVKQADARFNKLLATEGTDVPQQIFVSSPGELGLGRWLWTNTDLEFTLLPGGDVSHPRQRASWTCADLTAPIRTYQIVWDNGYTDTMTVSWDGSVLSGQNQEGLKLTAVRVDGGAQVRGGPALASAAGAATPVDPAPQYRKWTTRASGNQVEAVILDKLSDNSQVVLMKRDGKRIPVKTALLIPEDAEFVKNWAKPPGTSPSSISTK